MAATINIKIKTDGSQTQERLDVRKGSDKDREGLQALRALLRRIANRQKRATIYVGTSSAAPVAASGTWTLATVIATDACTVGKDTFTFSAGAPATDNDVNVTVASAKAFASATDLSLDTGTITETGHGYLTGDVGQLSTSGTLPTGFSASTDYHVIKVDADSYRLASSQANAVAGIPIYPTALGSGNQTFTPNDDKSLAFRLAQAVNANADTSLIVKATAADAVVTVTALEKGIIGNYIAFSDADATITSSGSGYLENGTGGTQEEDQTYDCGL